MRRAVIAAVSAGCVAGLLAPAMAAAPVDAGRGAETEMTFRVPGAGRLVVDLAAVELSEGPRLLVTTWSCATGDVCTGHSYVADLPADDLSVAEDETRGALRTVLAGRPLKVSWSPAADGAVVIGGGTLEGSGSSVAGDEFAGTSADVDLRFGDDSCEGDGAVGEAVLLDSAAVVGEDIREPISAFSLPAGAVLHC